jgi:subfamily B ATP-binding cassette protein HlyB/CyaB
MVEQQLKHNDCGIAAVRIVYNIFQIPVSRDFIEERLHLTEAGASLHDIKDFFDKQEFSTEFRLLDPNTLKHDLARLKPLLPCILPVQSHQGQHFVVVSSVGKKKIQVLDPATSQRYSWTWSELAAKAHTGTANYDLVSSRALFRQVIGDELALYSIDPQRLEGQDDADVLNKLTYFSYLKEHFGFSGRQAEQAFLEDLLFNQKLSVVPDQFRTLRFSRDKLRITAPVVLSIKPPATPVTTPSAPQRPLSAYRKLINEMKGYHRLWFIYIFTAVAAASIGQVTIFSSQILIDKILPGGKLSLLFLFALGYVVFKLVDLCLSLYKSFLAIRLANVFDHYFLTSFVEKLNSFSIRYIHTFSRGDLTERVKDSLKLKTFFIRFFTHFLIDGFITLYSLAILFVLSWKVALVVSGILVLFVVWFKIITPYIRENEQRRFVEKSSLFSSLFENIDGLQVIKSFRLEALFTQRLAPKINSILQIQRRSRYVSVVNSAVTTLLIIGATVSIMVMLSRSAILHDAITTGQIITFIALSRQIFSSISSLLDENLDLQENEIILNRYFAFSKPDGQQQQAAPKSHNLIRLSSLEQIEFKGIGFHYIPQKPVLDDLNIIIRRGDKLRMEGTNGAGKSTFCKVLSLLYAPDKGDILINGEKHQFFHPETLRKRILLVSNEDILFNDTLAYNITFSHQASAKKILSLAKDIGLYDFIAEKPEGLDYIINEQGGNLSTGQRKKILIMRALLSDAELIIMDETLSGIDRESKERIESYINNLTDRSFIIISHEPVSGIDFTQTLRMQNGRIEQVKYQGLDVIE